LKLQACTPSVDCAGPPRAVCSHPRSTSRSRCAHILLRSAPPNAFWLAARPGHINCGVLETVGGGSSARRPSGGDVMELTGLTGTRLPPQARPAARQTEQEPTKYRKTQGIGTVGRAGHAPPGGRPEGRDARKTCQELSKPVKKEGRAPAQPCRSRVRGPLRPGWQATNPQTFCPAGKHQRRRTCPDHPVEIVGAGTAEAASDAGGLPTVLPRPCCCLDPYAIVGDKAHWGTKPRVESSEPGTESAISLDQRHDDRYLQE